MQKKYPCLWKGSLSYIFKIVFLYDAYVPYLIFCSPPKFNEGRVKHFPNKPRFLRVCSTSVLKTLREKEKLLITSNSTFCHSVFYPFGELSAISIEFKIVVCKLFQFGRVENLLFGKGLK